MVLEDTLSLGANDTIIAPATIAGTGAISVIRMSGTKALEIADKLVRFRSGNASECPGGRVKFGEIQHDGGILDEVLCSVFHAPHSYTGEDSVEISCHASPYIVNTIIELACSGGARIATAGEFTRRAYTNGKMDLTQAEAVADIIASGDKAAHDVAMRQLRGGFSNELRQLRASLLHMTALLELELDFSEEDVEFAGREQLRALLDESCAKVKTLADSFKLGNAIKNGVPVAIVGAPNSGKSTLLNAILQEQRAIVSDVAGTTRDTIEECFVADGIRFRLVDTAGIRESEDTVEKIGIERSFDALHKADIVLVVIDLSKASDQSQMESLKEILSETDIRSQKVFYVLNKLDLVDGSESENNGKEPCNIFVNTYNNIVKWFNLQNVTISAESIALDSIPLAAKNGKGLPELLSKLSEYEKTRQKCIDGDVTLVTNARHHAALKNSLEALLQVRKSLDLGIPTDLLAEDLRTALSHLGSITGEISTDEVLGEIFSRFCIGK